jgi:hypothetical protein
LSSFNHTNPILYARKYSYIYVSMSIYEYIIDDVHTYIKFQTTNIYIKHIYIYIYIYITIHQSIYIHTCLRCLNTCCRNINNSLNRPLILSGVIRLYNIYKIKINICINKGLVRCINKRQNIYKNISNICFNTCCWNINVLLTDFLYSQALCD